MGKAGNQPRQAGGEHCADYCDSRIVLRSAWDNNGGTTGGGVQYTGDGGSCTSGSNDTRHQVDMEEVGRSRDVDI